MPKKYLTQGNNMLTGDEEGESPEAAARRTWGLDEQERETLQEQRATRMAALQRQLESAFVPDEAGLIHAKGFTLSPVGLLVEDGASLDDWRALGLMLLRLQGALQWLLGDWLVAGEERWGLTREQIAGVFGREMQTLYNYTWVCRGVKISLRKETLSFGHHNLVAGMPDEAQAYWLEEAEANGWGVAKLRAMILGERQAAVEPRVLGRPVYRQTFERIWRAVERGEQANRADITRLKAWIEAVERGMDE